MDERTAKIMLEVGDDPPTSLSASDVVRTIRSLEGQPDITVTISREGTDERLLVAISGGHAFLGLDGPEGIIQFVVPGQHSGTQRLVIGGQATDIESRYVLCVEKAATVAYEWLKGGRQSSLGAWERQ
jgi:hypothetical protein